MFTLTSRAFAAVGWGILGVAIVFIMAGILFPLGYPVMVLGLMMTAVVFASFGAAASLVRARRAALILGYLHHAVRLNLPLAPFLAAARLNEVTRTEASPKRSTARRI